MARTVKARLSRIEKLILSRIEQMLEDPDTSNGDVLKAAVFFCDHFRDDRDLGSEHVEVRFTE